MGHLVSSGFSRHGFGPDQGCAGGGMVAPFRPASRRPSIDVVATSGPLTWGTPLFSNRLGALTIRGELAIGRGSSRHNLVFGRSRAGPDHDAVMRIGGEAPGRRAHSRKRYRHHGLLRVTATPDRQRRRTISCSSGSACPCLHLSAPPHAARKTTPAGTSPVVSIRHSAISSFRARATIMVLRVQPRASAVRSYRRMLVTGGVRRQRLEFLG